MAQILNICVPIHMSLLNLSYYDCNDIKYINRISRCLKIINPKLNGSLIRYLLSRDFYIYKHYGRYVYITENGILVIDNIYVQKYYTQNGLLLCIGHEGIHAPM